MATLVFSALGTALGGPLGGMIGALVGRQVDGLIMPRPVREGPRLNELAVSASSYGTPLPRHFGRLRVPGTIIWASDLIEQAGRSGGGKGQAATNTYSYTASFAVALSSRLLVALGRIWADGKLLRGAAGDLKVAGALRLHHGHADQPADSLLASAEGTGQCPAYRGLAYVVFEDLALGEFGNRIPALTFEVIADAGPLSAAMLLETVAATAQSETSLSELTGVSLAGPPADLLSLLGHVIPMDCNLGAAGLEIGVSQAAPVPLGAAVLPVRDDGFGRQTGLSAKRLAAMPQPLGILRYYDPDRDYQPGVQRAASQPRGGEAASLDLPAAITAASARDLIERIAAHARWGQQSLVRRTAEIDPAIAPGRVVTLTERPGLWKVAAWEWLADGVELELLRIAQPLAHSFAADSGRAAVPLDLPAAPSLLEAFELPWNGGGSESGPAVWIAVGAAGPGWTGGALFAETLSGDLAELGIAARAPATMGVAVTALPPHSPHLLDRSSTIEVDLDNPGSALVSTTLTALLNGENRALIGDELIQFLHAELIAAQRWRLSGLLRGRGGIESAVTGHAVGERFILLDSQLVTLPLPQPSGGFSGRLALIGLGDAAPVLAPVRLPGLTCQPLAPVHGRASVTGAGGLALDWLRRARGAWRWPDQVEVSLVEQAEAWEIELRDAAATLARWTANSPALLIPPTTWAALHGLAPQGRFTVRQIGTHALSPPLVIPVPPPF